jgi:serine/threonine-protein kinase
VRDQQAGSGFLAEVGSGLATDSRIAGYWLEEQIGQGGMAVVFRARDERLHRLVALKVLAPALAGDGESRQRFIRESRAAAAVDDPHIIPVFEAGETAAGALFIAMRFVPGGDVYSLVRRTGPLSASRAAAIVSPVASALDAAHAARLVHRDVKPANMLLDTRPGRPDHVYLSDFGLSKGTVSTSTRLTGAGHFMGTLDYISPERIEGHQADGRADQYALACSAFEMLTGAPPFRSPEAAALMYAQLSQPPPPLTSRRPDLPAAVDQVFARALAKAPGDRYASCREFADAMRAAFGLAPYDSGPEPIPAVEQPPAGEHPAAAEHPPAEPARPTAADAVPEPAPSPPPASSAHPAPPAHPALPAHPVPPARHAAATPPAPPAPPATPARPAAFGHPAPARRRPSRRAILAALAAVLVLTAAAIGAYILHGKLSSRPLATTPIAAASRIAPVTGDDYVIYRAGTNASARVHGEVSHVTRGETAELYAQPFPDRHAPVPVGSVVLKASRSGAAYAFTVTPSLATRYYVELFPSSSATTPLARSRTVTIYVTRDVSGGRAPKCANPLCPPVVHMHVFVPASAIGTELSKRWYTYVGPAPGAAVKLQLLGPGNPKVRQLLKAVSPQVSRPRRVSATQFDLTLRFPSGYGQVLSLWHFAACTADTETRDGLGLPGRHQCGASSVPPASYLG